MIETRFFGQMQECVVDGKHLAPPRPLAFYPDRLAWHMNVHRTMLRKVGLARAFQSVGAGGRRGGLGCASDACTSSRVLTLGRVCR